MDSLERLSASVEQLLLLCRALRRERDELATMLAENARTSGTHAEVSGQAIQELRTEVQRLQQELSPEADLQRRVRESELEAAHLAQTLEDERQQTQQALAREHQRGLEGIETERLAIAELQARYEARVAQLENEVAVAKVDERMPVDEATLAAAQAVASENDGELQRLRVELVAKDSIVHGMRARAEAAEAVVAQVQARVADAMAEEARLRDQIESERREMIARADQNVAPEEIAALNEQLRQREAELVPLRSLAGLRDRLDAERQALRVEKRGVERYQKERGLLKRRLEELDATLASVRLSG